MMNNAIKIISAYTTILKSGDEESLLYQYQAIIVMPEWMKESEQMLSEMQLLTRIYPQICYTHLEMASTTTSKYLDTLPQTRDGSTLMSYI